MVAVVLLPVPPLVVVWVVGGGSASCTSRAVIFYAGIAVKLIYASPYDSQPWQLASRRANKLRQRLGITGLGVSDEPPGMLVADYERLLEATLQAEIQATEAGTARLLQLVAWIDRRVTGAALAASLSLRSLCNRRSTS